MSSKYILLILIPIFLLFSCYKSTEWEDVTADYDPVLNVIGIISLDKNIESFVKKKQFLYHSCWEVDNIDTAIKSFSDNGSVLISEPTPSLLFNNRKVAFLYTSVGILELLESE